MAVVAHVSSLIVVGVFDLAREIHLLEPADRAVVMDLVRCLRSADASRSIAVDTPLPRAVPRLIIPR